jgi:hypothetical protein
MNIASSYVRIAASGPASSAASSAASSTGCADAAPRTWLVKSA